MMKKWERKRGGLCAVVRGRSKEVRMVRNGLMWAACLTAGTRVTSGLELLPRTMSGSLVLL